MLAAYISRLRQRLIAQMPKKSASCSAVETPAAPVPSRMSWQAKCKNRGLAPLSLDKSLPPTPRASISTFHLPQEAVEKLAAAPSASASLIERAHSIAQEQDRAHAEFISQEGGAWHIPTIAGPSDLVKDALMWLEHEDKLSKIRQEVFGGSMGDDTVCKYDRRNGCVAV